MTGAGVFAQFRLTPGDGCPLYAVLADNDVQRLRTGGPEAVAQVVVAGDAAGVEGSPRLRPIVETAASVVCRLVADGDRGLAGACGNRRCLLEALGELPVRPFDRTFDGTAVTLSFAATESEVRRTKRWLEDAGFELSLQKLTRQGDGRPPELVVVDRGVLTDRQREVARLAVARGYPGAEAPAAGELAAELDIEKSTFSEHLRAVRRTVAEQIFPGAVPR